MTLYELRSLREGLYHPIDKRCSITLKDTSNGKEDTFVVSPYRVRLKLAQMEGWSQEKLSNIFVEVYLVD